MLFFILLGCGEKKSSALEEINSTNVSVIISENKNNVTTLQKQAQYIKLIDILPN